MENKLSRFSGFLFFVIFYFAFLTSVVSSVNYGRKLTDLKDNEAEECQKEENIHYEFTECVEGERWKVAVPSSDRCAKYFTPKLPTRVDKCIFSCPAGYFLNTGTLECEPCDVGTFSMGGGIKFENFKDLPKGFMAKVDKFHSMFSSLGRVNVNCQKLGWKAQKNVLISEGGPCLSSLTFSTQLVKPGRIRFEYQYLDDTKVFFQFQIKGDKCENSDGENSNHWLPLSEVGEWKALEFELLSGLNIFQWKTIGTDFQPSVKPIVIKSIIVEGIGYTSECISCSNGTFSNQIAATSCHLCPPNTFSYFQASKCIPCNKNEFANQGSSKCSLRPPCSQSDYYPMFGNCENNKRKVHYHWQEPKVCLTSLEQSINLPPEKILPCRCNPGFEIKNEKCVPCPKSYYSNGNSDSKCKPCIDSIPMTDLILTEWFELPSQISTSCISALENGCTNVPSWQIYGDHIKTIGNFHSVSAYLIMVLSIASGFKEPDLNENLIENEPVGKITFSFDMKCKSDCEFLLLISFEQKNQVLHRWAGSQKGSNFTYQINPKKDVAYNFSWIFQKISSDFTPSTGMDSLYNTENEELWTMNLSDQENWVKIYQIKISGVSNGVSTSCSNCKEGFIIHDRSNDGYPICIKNCSKNYNKNDRNNNYGKQPDEESDEFILRPKDKFHHHSHHQSKPGAEDSSCDSICSEKLTIGRNEYVIIDEKSAFNNIGTETEFENDCPNHFCTFSIADKFGIARNFDLSRLNGSHAVFSRSFFTASGSEYYHSFNFSFCAQQDSTCTKNISFYQNGLESENLIVSAKICQSTIFPFATSPNDKNMESLDGGGGGMDGMEERKSFVSTFATSLGDHLLAIKSGSLRELELLWGRESLKNVFFHFFYTTAESTVACSRGRNTTISFECKLKDDQWNGNEIITPDRCPDGTCDGCNFYFKWITPYACSICDINQVKVVRGECKNEEQMLHYIGAKNADCLFKLDPSWPIKQKCANHLPLFIEIAIQFAFGLALLLLVIVITFWNKNRKLEYKYMKLKSSENRMSNSTFGYGQDQELPLAESCSLDPEEDEEDEDGGDINDLPESQAYDSTYPFKEVQFYTGRTIKNFVSKIKIPTLKTFKRKGESASLREEEEILS